MLWNKRVEWSDQNVTVYRYGQNQSWTGEPTEPTVSFVRINDNHLKLNLVHFSIKNFEQRKDILVGAQSAYFIAVIVVQWIDVIINKTRRLSVFSQGMR